MFDNMLVVYANELHTGWDHAPGPTPTWWAGKLGGDDPEHRPLHRLRRRLRPQPDAVHHRPRHGRHQRQPGRRHGQGRHPAQHPGLGRLRNPQSTATNSTFRYWPSAKPGGSGWSAPGPRLLQHAHACGRPAWRRRRRCARSPRRSTFCEQEQVTRMAPGAQAPQGQGVQPLVALAGGLQILAGAGELRADRSPPGRRSAGWRSPGSGRCRPRPRCTVEPVGGGVGLDAGHRAGRAVDRGHLARRRRGPPAARSRRRRRSSRARGRPGPAAPPGCGSAAGRGTCRSSARPAARPPGAMPSSRQATRAPPRPRRPRATGR